ncbi:hypothetical protein CPB83DRAFT_860699 [Crepidotus variabilis]|uniref:Uncharacterized protein n=1 Tax=Crepidotus variabilis TaxID=179855 RepID=A0A9P6E9D9_9AGAR|nr:hypothetical protein CPB83DRAFT_860699 [Crepidotus variabilis]
MQANKIEQEKNGDAQNCALRPDDRVVIKPREHEQQKIEEAYDKQPHRRSMQYSRVEPWYRLEE